MAKLLTLLLLFLQETTAINFNQLPTLTLDGRNPVFQCDDQIFRINKRDNLQIHCNENLLHNYLRLNYFEAFQEIHLLYVPDEDRYNRCDSTGSETLLTCGKANEGKSRECINGKCTHFYQMKGIVFNNFHPGRLHHFIVIATDGKMDPKVPCQGNHTEFPAPMKFKVYVCTDEEEAAGLCEPCLTEACYYAHCRQRCDEWKVSSSSIFQDKHGRCFKHQTQTCYMPHTRIVQNNTREVAIPCPSPQCTNWRKSELYSYKNGFCFQQQQRSCTDFRGNTTGESRSVNITCPKKQCKSWALIEKSSRYTNDDKDVQCFEIRNRLCRFDKGVNGGMDQLFLETKEDNVTCSGPIVLPSTSEQNEDDKESLYINIIVGGSIGAFILGILTGFCMLKCVHSQTKKVEIVKTVEKFVPVEGLGPAVMGYDNKHFHLDPVLEDGVSQGFSLADIEFVPATQHNGTTKRQVMVARSVSFYTPEVVNGQQINRRNSESSKYRPPSTIQESNRNVMRHPSATSKTVLIRNHSDGLDRPRSDSDTSVFDLKQPQDSVSEEV